MQTTPSDIRSDAQEGVKRFLEAINLVFTDSLHCGFKSRVNEVFKVVQDLGLSKVDRPLQVMSTSLKSLNKEMASIIAAVDTVGTIDPQLANVVHTHSRMESSARALATLEQTSKNNALRDRLSFLNDIEQTPAPTKRPGAALR